MLIDERSIRITPRIATLIADIEAFKGEWGQVKQQNPDRLLALQKIASIESIGSSTRIEGAKLSDREIEKLLSQVKESFTSRDEQEVAGYALACKRIFDHADEMPLTENMIKEMHVWLLKYSEKDDRHRGEYKKIPIRIEAFDQQGVSIGVLFETTSPLETPMQMEALVHWTREALKSKEPHPLVVIGIFVVIFLAIHPFQDGNGRLSRLLTTYLLMRSGYTYAPYSSLESIVEANKESYYLALQQTQRSWQKHQVDWVPWLEFFFDCLQRQITHLKVKMFI